MLQPWYNLHYILHTCNITVKIEGSFYPSLGYPGCIHKVHGDLGMHLQVQSVIGSGAIDHQRLSGFHGCFKCLVVS